MNQKTHILLVEDNPGDVRLVVEMLKPYPSFYLQSVGLMSQAIAELHKIELGIILLDLSLPDTNGIDAIETIRKIRNDIPLVILTGSDNADIAVNALRLGADDFLVKNRMNPELLEKSIQHAIQKKHAENERDLFFSVSLDLLCVAGTDGYFKRVNPAFFKVLGYTAEEMCARPIVDFVHPEDIQHTIDEISRQSKGYSTLAFENRYLCKNGEYKYLSWKSVPVGSLLYATARDMTEFKKDKLRLIHADRMVAVGTLAAGIGHEINNPLAYTLANLSLIAEELEKKEILNNPNALVSAREKISRCLEGVNRVKDVMRGLKLFSKNDGDTVEPLDLATVMDSSLRMAMHEIQPRAQIVKEYAAVPLVDGNESQIGQVFLNLLINAAHSIREGNPGSNSITLIIGADGEKVFVRVKDTGSGISDEVLPRIFEAFFTTKAGDVGTGLGLSICEKIVTSYNGSITVASQVGEGTCFTVSFPKSSLKAPIRHREKIDSKSSKPRFRILVVDDEPSLTEAIVSTIGEGHDTKALNNGKEARDHLLENPHYDLILCDLMMPGFSGMNLHEALKLDGRGLERKIIFMTGGAYTPETVRFLREAENEYLEKPFELKTIRELVMKLS